MRNSPKPLVMADPSITEAPGRVVISASKADRKFSDEEPRRREASAATVDLCIDALREDARIAFFPPMGNVAPMPNRDWVAKHPLRPAEVDELLARSAAARPDAVVEPDAAAGSGSTDN